VKIYTKVHQELQS